MGWQAWFTLGILAFTFIVLIRATAPPDMVLWGATVAVTVAGVISPRQALAGLSSESVLTIAGLFVIAAAMRETGALDLLGGHMLGKARSERGVLLRMVPQVTVFSAFLANTAVVAMLIPIITDWCRKARVSPSRLLMPLSFLAILGGMCTLIGTTTNLIVSEAMEQAHLRAMHMFELTWLGVPSVVVGASYLVLVAPRLLPNRRDLLERIGDSARQYLVEMRIRPGCPLSGKTVEEAGLRRLPGLFLVEIVRDGRIIAPVEPHEVLIEGDQLAFAGVVQTIVDLERIPGFVPVTEETHDASFAEKRNRRYCEAVISATSPLIARNIRDSNFRALYNAAVIAVHRGGTRLRGRIGDIVLREGDTLLLQAGAHFVEANRNNPDFYLVSSLDSVRPIRHERTAICIGLLVLLVVLLVFGERISAMFGGQISLRPVVAALVVAGLMMLTGCISVSDARRAVSLDVLLIIAAAFGLATALQTSGAAAAIAHQLVALTNTGSALVALSVVYLLTVVLGIFITNRAAALLIFPIAMVMAQQLGLNPRAFAITVAGAAVASFASPISYQTNTMVYGAGGYRFGDFVRVGLPLHVLLWIVAMIVIPVVWPLHLGG